MPCKIPFKVVYVSSQEENYKSTELNIHGPTTKGWQSTRYCSYPQDVVIQLDKRTKIKKIQILSHQYLIATKIEFYIGDVPDSSDVSVRNARYIRLGYVALSDNDKTGHRARELKSVHVDAVGHFVKLVIHKSHLNKYNLFNQVSLIAINIIGDEIPDSSSKGNSSLRNSLEAPLLPMDRPDYISPLDDLSFDMYQDPEIAQVVRKLERKKQEAVAEERYDYATKLKTTIQQLQRVGEKLGKIEVEKRQAVESEDYDKAKLKKLQMNEYRKQVYEQLQINQLLDDQSTNINQSKSLLPALPTPDDYGTPIRQNTPPIVLPPDSEPTSSRHVSPLPPSTLYDERPLPAIRSKLQREGRRDIPGTPWSTPPSPGERILAHSLATASNTHPHNKFKTAERPESVSDVASERPADEPTVDDADTSGFLGNGPLEPEPLSERDMREAGPIIDVFGLNLACKAYSKHWSFREEALSDVHRLMSELNIGTDKDEAKALLRTAVIVFNRAIKDNVLSVFTGAVNLHRMVQSEFIAKHRIPKAESAMFLEKTMPCLLLKTGDSSARQRDAAKALIIEESNFPDVKALQGLLIHECVKPFKSSVAPRLALSRTEIVESLYSTHGLGVLTVDNMMMFLSQSLAHTSGEVRDAAERVIIALYREVGVAVREYLPADSEQTRKSIIYKQLFKEFAKIDGKLGLDDERHDVGDSSTHEDMNSVITKTKDSKSKANAAAGTKSMKKLKSVDDGEKMSDTRTVPLHQDLTCIFCNEVNELFTDDGLDSHYWKNCPMLKRCAHCKQVVEIASLVEHLVNECDALAEYNLCPRCAEAIPVKLFAEHTADKSCSPMEPGKSRCPLCHSNIVATEQSWKAHLMGRDGCKQNPRRVQANKNSKGTASPQHANRSNANVAKGKYK